MNGFKRLSGSNLLQFFCISCWWREFRMVGRLPSDPLVRVLLYQQIFFLIISSYLIHTKGSTARCLALSWCSSIHSTFIWRLPFDCSVLRGQKIDVQLHYVHELFRMSCPLYDNWEATLQQSKTKCRWGFFFFLVSVVKFSISWEPNLSHFFFSSDPSCYFLCDIIDIDIVENLVLFFIFM